MAFVRGQDLSERTRLLLPKAPELLETPFPIPTSAYAALDDIEAAVSAFAPDLVLLFSAYWMAPDRVASATALEAFVARLREQGRRVVTSDPFLGLAPRLTGGEVDARMLALNQPVLARWVIRLVIAVRGPRARVITLPRLEQVTHLYPTAAPPVADGTERVTFFNPTFARDASARVADGGAEAEPDASRSGARWVFVVSEPDVRSQSALVGVGEFLKNVVHMLQYAVEAGRCATLIAPASLLRQIGDVASTWGELLSFRSPADVESRLLEAEYAFFWDAGSLFQLSRLAAGLPVFHFDRGYLARAIRPYYDVARQCFFGGWEPKYVDPRQIFSPYVLEHLAVTQKESLAGVRQRWRSAPTPDELVTWLASHAE
jgi:hypothetical protein